MDGCGIQQHKSSICLCKWVSNTKKKQKSSMRDEKHTPKVLVVRDDDLPN